ncbi:NAD(P)H-dependent oxidoreductase [Paenibacillus sp. sptzw28]|uniref:NAD(P)H-dependent oxidoreductase n=1 Tax=Paenibacillus sp. sptzw28 TaxID=715179 RepID=UPI001C6E2D50|nr:NAD(P)H-dependent oxidoreductase [Paenibacillus sp. sptzw28]QYR21061.1 NAD(P)H-dependent oxidoreductase [Paenibacillus sp. sptzw28]
MDKEQILAAYRFRHACKEFDSTKKISDDDFEFILETGRLSPSSFGFEPWQFIVLQNPQLREQLIPYAEGARKQLPTCSHYIIMLSRKKSEMVADSEYTRMIMNNVKGMPEETVKYLTAFYNNFLQTDFALIDNERAMFEWASRQTYIALGNMMTAAAQIGIDSCPIEGFNKEGLERILAENGLIDLNRLGVSCMVAFGYRLQEPRPKTRRPIDQVVQWVD